MEYPDELLSSMWESIDWEKEKIKLKKLQKRLSKAASQGNKLKVEHIQKKIVRDIGIKCLAVRHVVSSTSKAGVDGVIWKTSSEMMNAALSLDSKGYKAAPLKQIVIVANNSRKERRPRIPTYYDRTMGVLYGYSLIPVTEALADRKSFAFRLARSVHDAHAYLMDALRGDDAPHYVVCGDIQGYYSNIQHSWLLKHVPMDKKVLSEFLKSGYVFAGELFPSEDTGISEGSNLSPFLGNFVLDGLQKHIFMALNKGAVPEDFQDGNLIRFADDVVITCRSETSAKKIIEALEVFLEERGLKFAKGKTKIFKLDDGFTFLAQTYIKKNGILHTFPAEKAVDRFISDLKETIESNKKSQRELILKLNKKLKGWANYYKFSEAGPAFKKVDIALQALLLDEVRSRHPNMQLARLKKRYWYEEADGRFAYTLPDDKSLRVIHIEDTVLVNHHKVKTNLNPFIDHKYMALRGQKTQILNVTGKFKAIWERQSGRCFYCGRPILLDQPRDIVTIDQSQKESLNNQAYVHKICLSNEIIPVKMTDETLDKPSYDIKKTLRSLSHIEGKALYLKRTKSNITRRWKYYKLKEYFSFCKQASLSLNFKDIEAITGYSLPKSARKSSDWWYPREQTNRIAEAWITEGYALLKINMEKEKISFERTLDKQEHLRIPKELIDSKIPANAIFELETHMEYIMAKYGLK